MNECSYEHMFIWAYVHLIARNELGVTNLALMIESARTRGHVDVMKRVDAWTVG